MRKITYLLALSGFALVSCGTSSSETSSNSPSSEDTSKLTSEVIDTSTLNVLSPTGIPALAFYDQGSNKNFVTAVASTIPPNLAHSSWML